MLLRASWRRGRTILPLAATILVLLGGQLGYAEQLYHVERFVVAERKKDQVRTRIDGNWVVWKDYRSLSLRAVDDSPNAEIFAWNLETEEEREVSSTEHGGDPAISGTVVVWTEGDGRNSNRIRGHDLETGNPYYISNSRGRAERPSISGKLVVWQDNRDGNWDIWSRDLDLSDERPVVEQKEDQQNPAVSGRIVVWEDWRDRGSGPDVYGRDLESGRRFRVTDNKDAYEPAISGEWVVWVGRADPGVFARKLDEGPVLKLSTAGGHKLRPAISGDVVVWSDERNGDRDIFGYDLATRREFVVAQAAGNQDDPDVEDGRIVWSDARGPNRDVYAGSVNLPAETRTKDPVVAAPPAPTSTPSRAASQSSSALRLRVVDDGVNLRTEPSTSAAILTTLTKGTELEAVGDTKSADGRSWRPVRDPSGQKGWVAAEFVAPF